MNKREIKRIALFLPSLRGGGAERVMVNLVRGFMERGLKVDVVLSRAEGPYLSELVPEARLIDLNARRVLYSLPGLIRYLRRERPNIMISTLDHANIVAIWARLMARVPLRLIIREASTPSLSAQAASTIRGKLMPIFLYLFYRYADAIVANSEGVAADLIKVTRLPEEKFRVIYNPVITPDLFIKAEDEVDHPWFGPGQPPVILGVGRLSPEKDFVTLIRAYALVRKDWQARLIILGEGKERYKLEAIIKKLGLENEVCMPGFVENPIKYMKRAAVFVLSSKREGLPNALIQALAVGRPVVSTDCPNGPREILNEGKLGKLVPVGNAEAMAESILSCLAAKEGSQLIGKPDDALKKYTLEQVLDCYLNLMCVSRD